MVCSRHLVGSLMIYFFLLTSGWSDDSFPVPSWRSDDLSVSSACKAGRRWCWNCLKWACHGNTFSCISHMLISFISFVLSWVLESGGVLDFSVLPSTSEGTWRASRSGKFARWALRHCYAGNVTVTKLLSFYWAHLAPFFFFFCPHVWPFKLR